MAGEVLMRLCVGWHCFEKGPRTHNWTNGFLELILETITNFIKPLNLFNWLIEIQRDVRGWGKNIDFFF